MLGSRVDERRFRRQPNSGIDIVMANHPHPHRAWLVNQILSPDIRSALEVGCGYGANLEVLARIDSTLTLRGLDISPVAISEGRRWLDAAGLSNVTLDISRADDLSSIGEQSSDLVFTDAVLLYVGPDKIQRTVSEMIRIARRRVAFLEFHSEGTGAGGRYMQDGWLRDYRALFAAVAPQMSVNITRLPPDLWQSGRWPLYGTLIEVNLDPTGSGPDA